MTALLGIAILLMLGGAVMLVIDLGASTLAIAAVAVGVALVALVTGGGRFSHR